MGSPILLIIFWIIVNIIISAGKSKNKQQNQRVDRRIDNSIGKSLGNTVDTTYTTTKQSGQIRNLVDVFKQEIEKEIQREKDLQQKRKQEINGNTDVFSSAQQKNQAAVKKRRTQKAVAEKLNPDNIIEDKRKRYDDYDLHVDENIMGEVEMLDSEDIEEKRLDFKKDVLNGIIFSEILSKPKGLKKYDF